MTKLCVVAPSHEPNWTLLGDMGFFQMGWSYPLRHLLESFFVIVDNQHPVSSDSCAIETSSFDKYAAFASKIANEVIIPDVLNDALKTIQYIKEWFSSDSLKYVESLRQMFVPQGKDVGEWVGCLNWLLNSPYAYRVQTIGVPMWLEKFVPRYNLLDYIPDQYDVHFLGCWRGAEEMCNIPRVRSWDTSIPISAAQNMMYLISNPTIKTHLTDGPADPECALANISYLRGKLHGTT